MEKKKNISLSINPKLYDILDENFDNKAKLIEWAIVHILSMDNEFKDKLKNIEL